MIIVRTPLRISLGGGGTDLPSYYDKYGGYLVTAAINKYIYIMVNPRFDDTIRVSYSETEIVDTIDEIKHPIVREALKLLGLGPGLEIVSVADLPANTGLGSSGSFTVGLLHALHVYKRDPISAEALAEEAFHVEAELLGEPVGKQDQYAAALGGINALLIGQDGTVTVDQFRFGDAFEQDFEHEIRLFYTGIRRSASTILAGTGKALSAEKKDVTGALHTIKQIGYDITRALTEEDLPAFGRLLDDHWNTKKLMSREISSNEIDEWYAIAKSKGALGGKIMGAGGGGFFMLYAEHNGINGLREALNTQGLREMRFSIDHEGSKLVGNI